ncbi:hypothetical protein [Mycobacterium sp. HUMS_1102779]|uniref:hypothetical protein n=1 Tax=Mycobacterium sp. HUMS_1102779 TaxID=3383487 RepID=UPI00389B105E
MTGGPAETIEGANRDRAIDYHLYGPSGIRYYQDPSSPPEKRGSFTMDVGAAAGDGTQVKRSYVAARDGDRPLRARHPSQRSGSGMEVLGRAQLSSPIRYLGTDDTRIYAATDHDLTVLETASFIGYPNGAIPVVRTVDYRAALPAGQVAAAPVVGHGSRPREGVPDAARPALRDQRGKAAPVKEDDMNGAAKNPAPVGIDDGVAFLTEQMERLKELGECDSGRDQFGDFGVYDLSVRWGTALAGRLPRIAHYSSAGLLTDDDKRRFQSLCDELRELSPLIERFKLARPDLADRPDASGLPDRRREMPGWPRRRGTSRFAVHAD